MSKQSIKRLVILFVVGIAMIVSSTILQAGPTDGVTGYWRTFSDETGKIIYKVHLFKHKNKLYGRIVKLYHPAEPNPICAKCTGWAKNKPIRGLLFIWGLKKGRDAWEGGKWLDPNNGKTYSCKIWREGSKLKMRGYLGFIYRTQTWIK